MSRVVVLVRGRGLEGLRRVEERIVGDRVVGPGSYAG
jgi:hypothetical protein